MKKPSRQARSAIPTVRVGGAFAIPEVLRQLGADPATVLAEVGVDVRLFDDPDNLIPYAKRARLLEHCVARTGCVHFGLLVGQRGGLESLGIVGLLSKCSPDVGEALLSLSRHLRVHARGAVIELSNFGELAKLSYSITRSKVVAADQIGDAAVAMMFNAMLTLCGPKWKPLEVCFIHHAPQDLRPYRQFFRAPLTFDAGANAVMFHSDWLQRPLINSDQELQRVLAKRVRELEAEFRDDVPEQVRGVLRTVLLTDHARADKIAAQFGVDRRTLNRRLGEYGLSFQGLLDEIRFEVAGQMLETSGMDVAQIADLLHYVDASTFTRAFRRWSNATPGQWRKRRQGRLGA